MAVYSTPPDVADLLAHTSLTGANYSEAEAQAALDAASTEIGHLCVVEPYEAPLREATLRRATTILTARGAPLSQLDLGQFGMSPLLRYDPELGKLLAPYLRGAFA